ncbi:MAG: efflux RND transporter periplasmic adaptor subunit, partial [Planctomycetota bacterium]
LYEPEIIELVQLNVLKVEFSVPHQVAAQLTTGDSVTLRIGRQTPEKAEGEIRFVSPVVDAQTGTSRVKVRIQNPDLQFRAGVSCQLVIEQEQLP